MRPKQTQIAEDSSRNERGPAKDKPSIKEHLLSIPEVGEDADFERIADRGLGRRDPFEA
jgi:hypothetical protein